MKKDLRMLVAWILSGVMTVMFFDRTAPSFHKALDETYEGFNDHQKEYSRNFYLISAGAILGPILPIVAIKHFIGGVINEVKEIIKGKAE